MKDNGIGRPSTRAAIIETLFRRNYIRRERKNIVPTITGMGLIQTIQNELLKSAEMTGNWEFKLRQIEKGEYKADAFLQEMKQMVTDLVIQVKNESSKRIEVETEESKSKAKTEKTVHCPKCKSGNLVKGKTAFGCSNYKNGCDFKIPFHLLGKKLTDAQILMLADKGKTTPIKGFEIGGSKKDGVLILTPDFNVSFEEKEIVTKAKKETGPPTCPKCKAGTFIKGNTAYGCSNWKNGCNMRIPFTFMGKEISETILQQLAKKGETSVIKGLINGTESINAKLKFNSNFELEVG
jgi:DNA topoisomerase-3